MFSRKTAILIGVFLIFAVNLVLLSASSRRGYPPSAIGHVALPLIAPFQAGFSRVIRFARGLWADYFFLINVAGENDELRKALAQATEKNNQYFETDLSNQRLRKLLAFQKSSTGKVIAAEVIGRDPSPWFKTAIIDKGQSDGVTKGQPVVIAEGIAGQVVEVSPGFSKVLLLIDPNSAVDAVVQRTRARGIVKGVSEDRVVFHYVLRKHDVVVGDQVVSSGLDGVFPKGLSIGQVAEVIKRNAGIFQEVFVTPSVDFEKLEEVLVVLTLPRPELAETP